MRGNTYWCTASSSRRLSENLASIDVELLEFYQRADQEYESGGLGGCRNPSVTGTKADEDQCVIVRISLPNNNLKGYLTESLGRLEWLVYLDVSGNALSGPVPAFLTSRAWLSLNIVENGFYYSDAVDPFNQDACAAICKASEDDVSPTVRGLIQHCKQESNCIGMPPLSCDAFNSGGCESKCFFVVETLDPDACLKCDASMFLPILFMCLIGVGVILSLAFYGWLIYRYPSVLRGGISTFSILYHHAQTVRSERAPCRARTSPRAPLPAHMLTCGRPRVGR